VLVELPVECLEARYVDPVELHARLEGKLCAREMLPEIRRYRPKKYATSASRNEYDRAPNVGFAC
jgi:hypothetical protein